MKKIAVVTSTRAEYGVLRNTIQCIHDDQDLELCLIVAGTHLLPSYGLTITEIENDQFPITEKVDYLMHSSTHAAISKSMGMAFILFSEVFERQQPDFLIVVGDRFELIPICYTALNRDIPIAHISGGEVTEGVIDDVVRHCVTKMSLLHFPANDEYRKRIIQLGESPDRVFLFGDVGVENIVKTELIPQQEIYKMIGLADHTNYYCVTYHPTNEPIETIMRGINNLLHVIASKPAFNFIFTQANNDAGGERINEEIKAFTASHDNCRFFESLGSRKYLSLLKYSSGVVGNSSSGIIEAPTLKIPTIDIGNRQKGRIFANSVINCGLEVSEILAAFETLESEAFQSVLKNTTNPYQLGETSKNIVKTIKEYIGDQNYSKQKVFYDIQF